MVIIYHQRDTSEEDAFSFGNVKSTSNLVNGRVSVSTAPF